VKCETDAERDFASKVNIVDAALRKSLTEVDQGLYDTWVQRARAANPTFSIWEQDTKSWKGKADKVKASVFPNGSGESQALDYFGSSHDWTIIRSTDSLDTDYRRRPIINQDQVVRMHVKVTCSRPCSLLSRRTSISIAECPAPDNKRLIDRLKAELDRKATQYKIEDHPIH
jgi:hypothetical protein